MSEELNRGANEGMLEDGSNLEAPVIEGEGAPEIRIENAPEKAKETVGEKYTEILSKISSKAGSIPGSDEADDAQVEVDAKSVYDETDAEARVAKLLALAEAKGVVYAVRVTRKLDDFYVLDRMHDRLAEDFAEALKEKGMISAE